MDALLELGRNSLIRKLPITFPPRLRRSQDALSQRVLSDESVLLGANADSEVTAMLARQLAPLGARVAVWDKSVALESFLNAAVAWAEPVTELPAAVSLPVTAVPLPAQLAATGVETLTRNAALIFDASSGRSRLDLDRLYAFLHTGVSQLRSGGRIIVFAAAEGTDVEHAALHAAVEGVTRSLAKEVGRKGITCNLVRVVPGAAARAVGLLRFLLSCRSAFVTGQVFMLSGQVVTEQVPAFQALPLSGRVALVTGAARGIGAATAQTLAREGARVLILDHPAAAAAGSLLARQLGAEFIAADLSSLSAANELTQWLAQRQLGLDILVHNAGITRDKTLLKMSKEQWSAVLDVNLTAILNMNQQLLLSHKINDGARLIHLSSVAGIAGNVGQTNYAAAKAGLLGYVRRLALQLAERGISVNAVAPGLIETQMTAKMPAFVREVARRLSALNQGGLPSDVAETILMLCLPDACGLTGNTLRVCGGGFIGA